MTHKPPGEYERQQAAACRKAFQLAKEAGDVVHMVDLELLIRQWDDKVLWAVRRAREIDAGVEQHDSAW